MSRLFFLLAGLSFIGCTKDVSCHDNNKTVAEEEVTGKA